MNEDGLGTLRAFALALTRLWRCWMARMPTCIWKALRCTLICVDACNVLKLRLRALWSSSVNNLLSTDHCYVAVCLRDIVAKNEKEKRPACTHAFGQGVPFCRYVAPAKKYQGFLQLCMPGLCNMTLIYTGPPRIVHCESSWWICPCAWPATAFPQPIWRWIWFGRAERLGRSRLMLRPSSCVAAS